MKLVGNILRYTGILGVVLATSALLAHESWNLYESIFHDGGSSWINLGDVAGFAFSYALLNAIFIESLGERFRHWVLVLLYIPLLTYEYGLDFVDFKIILPLIISGVVIGALIRLIVTKALGKRLALEQYKRYF